MKSRIIVLIAVFALVFSAVACSKQDEAPITADKPGSSLPQGHPSTGGDPGGPIIAPVTQIVVPEGVKGVWGSALIALEDKSSGSTKDVKIPLNAEYTIEGSGLKLVVGDFLPDFRMDGSTITSSSPDPNNPAIQIKVIEGEEEIFSGWLYARFPAIHPFLHEKYGITLKSGVKN